ncbi:MAG: DUF2846 domain-containing protein [Candidatus Thiodiazotropha sp. (ex Monitilora ramsayi)]|nr:DUF2846 domain-containing protein [Candidatus Thiodiazotropha sp. (ex Monitilora ramsayi)]
MKSTLVTLTITFFLLITGCASVPMAAKEDDKARKEFTVPSADIAGLYIYRNSMIGGALKKTVSLNGKIIGETAPNTYFYKDIKPGRHILSTESEFSDNTLELNAKGGENYYVQQYIKLGVFVGGANLKLVSEEEGKKGVMECKLAVETNTIEQPSTSQLTE